VRTAHLSACRLFVSISLPAAWLAGCAGPSHAGDEPQADASLSALRDGPDAQGTGEGDATPSAYIDNALAAMEDFQTLDLDGEAQAGVTGAGDEQSDTVEAAALPDNAAGPPDTPEASEAGRPTPGESAPIERTAEVTTEAGPPGEDAPAQGSEPAPEPPLGARIEAAHRDLRALLRERAEAERSPVAGAVRSVLLEAVVGGGRDDSGPASERADLSEPERDVLDALASVLAAFRDEAVRTGTVDPSAILDALDGARRSVAAAGGMRLIDAAVCARVRGLGDYDPIEPAVYLRGRPIPLVVYAEARGFASEPYREDGSSGEGSRWRSRLELSVRLYSEADGVEVWRDSGGGAVMEGRRARSRAHLTALVELPARLSVGAYRLKVELRDRISGASDERLIPVKLVADPQLATNMPTSGE